MLFPSYMQINAVPFAFKLNPGDPYAPYVLGQPTDGLMYHKIKTRTTTALTIEGSKNFWLKVPDRINDYVRMAIQIV